ncbi:hypothetical protein [Sulfurovum sp.]|uniref:hypothetical protein n=1 Tax=Sulfurovum sp. TaxID=1969726 RepID=UPI002867FF26|nr:hypothetical protein [Sulfurovum sp.]
MSSQIGFKIQYVVNAVSSIKPTPSGIANGNAYEASVKLRSTNIVEVMDEKLGQVEVETNIEFTIYCEDNNLKNFNEWLRKKQKENTPLLISAGLPYKGEGKAIMQVKAFDTAEQMMSLDKPK